MLHCDVMLFSGHDLRKFLLAKKTEYKCFY